MMTSRSQSLMPFRVTTNFQLGLFLKKEKSTLNLGSNTKLVRSSASQERYADVDDYVTHEYWALDVEFLLCCINTILWSAFCLLLFYNILPDSCLESNQGVLVSSVVIIFMNILETLFSISSLIYAKYSHNWQYKIGILNLTIGIKLFLTALNFLFAILCTINNSCGFWYSVELHEYDTEIMPRGSKDYTEPPVNAEDVGLAIVNGFRYYDVKIVGVSLVFASVGIALGSMILMVKRNDIKMYALWRLGKLDQYINEINNPK